MNIGSIEKNKRLFTILGTCLPAVVPEDLDKLYSNGVLVDRRNQTPMEMDGYSAYLACKALEKKHHVDLRGEKNRILDACIRRCNDCGGFWTHGAWTGSSKEVHLRFTSAAIRLLVEGYKDGLITDAGFILGTLRKHLEFAEKIDGGLWFLHDSLELPGLGIEYPQRHCKNQFWGSSANNMLVLNTQIDTLVTMLFVLRSIEIGVDDKAIIVEKLNRGFDALRTVLHVNLSFAWKIFSAIDSRARFLMFKHMFSASVLARALPKGMNRIYMPLRQIIRSRFAGYVFEDGYIERDIALDGRGFEYHFVNVWDLAKFISEAEKSNYIQDKSFLDYCARIVEKGIDYAVSSPYWNYVVEGTKKHGGAMELCESMIIMSRIKKRNNKNWMNAFFSITNSVPPTSALFGYDPLVLDDSYDLETFLGAAV